MKLELGELVQWTEDGKHHTGRVLSDSGDPFVTYDYCRLVRHSYTGELHVVDFFHLSPYPSSPIPEPSK